MSTPRLDRVVAAIEAYLTSHPVAADSAAGIARWWLGQEGIEAGVDEVQGALERLVENGVVRARTLPGGERIYSAMRPPSTEAD